MKKLLAKGIALMVLTFLTGCNNEQYFLTDYFISCQTNHHLIQDRENDKNTISISATGFGFYAWEIAVEDGELSREEVIAWMNETILFIDNITPKRNGGWLFHFIDAKGKPKFTAEVSTIDTAIYYLSARKAAQKLGDKTLIDNVEKHIKDINIDLMMDGNMFRHGLIWNNNTPQYIPCHWDNYNEGILIYRLFNKPFKPDKVEYNLPLFVYYYPLCFYNDEEYKDNLHKAISWQIENYHYCGVTACDGPNGYCINDKSIISPMALWAASVYDKRAENLLNNLPYSKTTPSFSENWQSNERIGIDCGSCLMILRK